MKRLKNFLLRHFDWETWNWFSQVAFYAATALYMYVGVPRETQWYYFCFSTAALLTAFVNCLLPPSPFRIFLAVLHITLNAYLIPFTLFAYGSTPGLAAIGSVSYVVVSAALCPRLVGIVVVAAGIVFAYYQKVYYSGVTTDPATDLTMITSAYVGLAILGYCWRLLAQRLYEALASSNLANPAVASEEVLEQMEELKRDNQILKEEMAMHIVEINDIIGKSQSPSK